MTEPTDESLPPDTKDEGVSGTGTPVDPTAASSNVPVSNETIAPETAATVEGGEGLPEWEPLTPELVEDEAIRGDFVIRWAVVGLALLLGISQISETRTLVHVKNGLYLVGHGLLPGWNDHFSYTAADRIWVNLSWLFDVVSAGVYSLGGGIGLSLVQGATTGLAFGLLVHAARPNIRSWWGSICAVLALLVCYQQFTVQPELLTLLGISFLLWTLVRSEETGATAPLWTAIPVIWVWSQLDQRAWLGWLLLFLWAAGETLTRGATGGNRGGTLWKVALISFAVTAIHPFLWESWLAPYRMYAIDYPAIRAAYPRPIDVDQAYFPFWSRFFWSPPKHQPVAAVVLFLATLVTMSLNRSRLRLSHVLAFVGFNLLGFVAAHELAVASLVNCVVSTINAQTWYRERFGQVYSIDWRELLFSRGGRAVTVIGFFVLAWAVISGHLDGPNGKRTGVGFESSLATAMSDYQSLNLSLLDDHPFNFAYRQGDLMIWGGQKTFIDSRLSLYSGRGQSDLIAKHNAARLSLRQGIDEKDAAWRNVFSEYEIRQALPRLNRMVVAPDYVTMNELLYSKEFTLCGMNPSTAIFVRSEPPDRRVGEFLRDHALNFVYAAFRSKETVKDAPREWATPQTAYDALFSLRAPSTPPGALLAQHYLVLTESSPNHSLAQRCACGLLAVRAATEGLRTDPNSAAGYFVLGRAYNLLGMIESALLSQGGPPMPNVLRYYQSVAALQQALALDPENLAIIDSLIPQYASMGRVDVQYELYQRIKKIVPYSSTMSKEVSELRKKITERSAPLEEQVDRINQMVGDLLSKDHDRLEIAMAANQVGGLLKSIKVLEEDAVYLERNPRAKLSLAGWLMEVGRGREAAEIYENFEAIAREEPFDEWRNPAAILKMTMSNYPDSIRLWSEQMAATASTRTPDVMYTLPFTTLTPVWFGADGYPNTHVAAAAQFLQGVDADGAAIEYQMALASLELGDDEKATENVRRALKLYPSSPLRPAFAFYLECLTGEKIEPAVPATEAVEFTDLTAPPEDPEPPAAKTGATNSP